MSTDTRGCTESPADPTADKNEGDICKQEIPDSSVKRKQRGGYREKSKSRADQLFIVDSGVENHPRTQLNDWWFVRVLPDHLVLG